MRPALLDLTTAPFLTMADLNEYLRIAELGKRSLAAGWIKPCLTTGSTGAGKMLFKRSDVDALAARLANGEVPPSLPRKTES